MHAPQKKRVVYAHEDLPRAFQAFLSREGLKSTRQRDLIVGLFSQVEGHVSVEELLARVKAEDPAIGYATVYRTLKLLVRAGLASPRDFGDGYSRFEPRSEDHHDHMICESCGRIIEFTDGAIEKLQEEVARRHGFVLRRHRHELYGLCPDCQ